jgi:hypothetical protein
MTTERRLTAAATRWSDYIGTAAADGAEVVLDRPSVYELTGLDRDRWLVTAIDIEVLDGQMEAVVYAFDRLGGMDREVPLNVETVIAERGHLPVQAFPLGDGAGIQSFLDQVFRRVAIRLVARNFRDDAMVVHEVDGG